MKGAHTFMAHGTKKSRFSQAPRRKKPLNHGKYCNLILREVGSLNPLFALFMSYFEWNLAVYKAAAAALVVQHMKNVNGLCINGTRRMKPFGAELSSFFSLALFSSCKSVERYNIYFNTTDLGNAMCHVFSTLPSLDHIHFSPFFKVIIACVNHHIILHTRNLLMVYGDKLYFFK